jgi:secondary thiamine-phosphate synthase enzyme
MVLHSTISVQTRFQGLHEITEEVARSINAFEVENALCSIFIMHTSASLTIQENADPSARHDLEKWLNALVPEGNPAFTHTLEGLDDMPSHIKAILTQTSLTIPVIDGRLGLGTWQGIYVWEHRTTPHRRNVCVSIIE